MTNSCNRAALEPPRLLATLAGSPPNLGGESHSHFANLSQIDIFGIGRLSIRHVFRIVDSSEHADTIEHSKIR
jgi:hypothetical protein